MDRPTKDKPRRNSEKRREKSRDAARQRRTQETNVFTELAQNLPLPESRSSQLDKASIMRLTLATLKQTQIRSLISDKKTGEKCAKELEELNELEQKTLPLYPKALDGFLLIISKEGEIIFLSDQVVKFLGIQQIELLGQNIFEYTHPCDHDEFKDILSPKSHSFEQDPYRRSFSVRLKCTLTNKGRNINIKSASYKVIKFTGKLIFPPESKSSQNKNGNFFTYLFAFGEQIPHPSNIEVPLGHKTFLSQHSMDMKFTIWDEKIKELVGYNSDDIIGRPIYDYYHALDGEVVGKAYKDLMGKGQIMTEQYRFLAKKGGHVWVITQATIIYDPRSHKSQYVVCVHYVLSEIQNSEEILSVVQQVRSDDEEDVKEEIPVVVLEDKEVVMERVQSLPEDASPGPQLNTEKIFAPKTKDMDEDLFIQSSTAIPVNESLQDLTSRAPSAGDVCISLPFPTHDNDLKLTDPSLEMVKLKDEPSENKIIYLWDSNDDFSFRRSPHVGLITPTSDSEGPELSKMTSPPDYHLNSSLDEDIFVKFSTMDTNLEFTGRNSVNKMTKKEVFNKGKSLYDPDEWEIKNIFSDYKIEPMKSPESPKKSSNPDLPKNLPKAQLKQNGAGLLHAKRPIDISCLEKGPPEKNFKLDSTPLPFLDSSGGKSLNSAIVEESNKESVLRNLLVNGEDLNNGYSVNRPLTSPSFMTDLLFFNSESVSQTSNRLLLPRLTQSDCDVNAPVLSNGLLHGNEILKALDLDTSIVI